MLPAQFSAESVRAPEPCRDRVCGPTTNMENLRMRRTVWISALALSLALPLAAQAAEFDYSWLEAGYTSIEADDGPDADGWALNGSAAIAPQVHVFGSYAGTELDGVNIDGDVMRLGLGWNTGIAEAHDLVVRANYLKVDTDFPGGDGTATKPKSACAARSARISKPMSRPVTPTSTAAAAICTASLARSTSSARAGAWPPPSRWPTARTSTSSGRV
jgi:hypothetical protein